jgi:hypothetical protein
MHLKRIMMKGHIILHCRREPRFIACLPASSIFKDFEEMVNEKRIL